MEGTLKIVKKEDWNQRSVYHVLLKTKWTRIGSLGLWGFLREFRSFFDAHQYMMEYPNSELAFQKEENDHLRKQKEETTRSLSLPDGNKLGRLSLSDD